MYQQLSLYSHIPDAELRITLHTLAALSGMHPRQVFQHCLVWTPKYPFKPVLKAGQVNQIEQYRITTVSDVAKNESAAGFEEDAGALRQRKWTVNVYEVPEAGKRRVTSQSIMSSKIEDGDPFQFLDSLGYKLNQEYWLKGHQFVLGDIVIVLQRVCIKKSANGTSDDQMEIDSVKPLDLIDPSGRWFVKAYIDVKMLTDMDAMNSATAQLERLQSDMGGLFELTMPDRMSFDTRVKTR
ncbi:hypothetical protein TRVA0_002S00540 [Trichomonascus vanleenenianus]|uniref:Srb5p n=1 Tax=Trichomonascus vanleenenianus TaxID=2268995 RepID=UPI003EC9DF4D